MRGEEAEANLPGYMDYWRLLHLNNSSMHNDGPTTRRTGSYGTSCHDPPAQKQAQLDESVRSDAKWRCKEFVEKTLKAPSTADFQNYNNFFARGIGEGPFQVSGYVDAENSFGAKIRTQFICERRKTGDNWQLVNLSQTP